MEIYINTIDNIDWINANHRGIKKKVFFTTDIFRSNITQIAYSELNQDNEISTHAHETMEEVFFLFDGICEFQIDNKKFQATKNSVIRIPANTNHSLKAISNCKFIYFGVSI